MTLRWHLTEADVYDIVASAINNNKWSCDCTAECDAVMIDVDEIATAAARKLVTE